MSAFTESGFLKKIADLNQSQQSIQTVSLWVIHHRRHSKVIAELWFKQLMKADESRKLVLMYLANDVIQNSKKKGPEYGQEFGKILVNVFNHITENCKEELIFNKIDRILSIWEERGVYEAKHIKDWYAVLHPKEVEKLTKGTVDKKRRSPSDKSSSKEKFKVVGSQDKKLKIDTKVVEVNGQIETHVTLSPKKPPEECDPPEPEELIKVLLELENSASSDAVVREKITNLPPEVVEISLLAKFSDKDQAAKLAMQVDDAIKLLNDYNARLAEEMVVRKKLTTMLREFQLEQKELLKHVQQRLEEHKDKLKKAKEIQQAVRDQLKKLPDFTQLNVATDLPSAGDLFNLKR